MTRPRPYCVLSPPARPRRLRQRARHARDVGRDTSRVDHKRQASGARSQPQQFAARVRPVPRRRRHGRGLPDATPSVRALAAQAGPVPAARRRGTLRARRAARSPGGRHRYLLTARDDAHTFYAQMTLGQQHGRWLVTAAHAAGLRASIRAGRPAGAGTAPRVRGSRERRAAFLRGYLPWLYGQAPLRAITRPPRAALLAGLKAHPPRVPLTMRSLHPERRSDRDAAPRPRLAGAPEHQRRPRDLRARPHDRADAWPLAGQQRQQPAMNNPTDRPEKEVGAMHEPSDGDRRGGRTPAAARARRRRDRGTTRDRHAPTRDRAGQHESAQAAPAAQARIDAERQLAAARLQPVFDPGWWETARPQDDRRHVAGGQQLAGPRPAGGRTPTIFDHAAAPNPPGGTRSHRP